MTKRLEETFNLPGIEELDFDLSMTEVAKKADEQIQAEVEQLKQIEKEIGTIIDLSESEKETDELAAKALTAFTDLMDLGMTTEPRFSSPIFSVAKDFLGHAINAKHAKVERKLKAVDLQLKKMKIQSSGSTKDESTDETIQGEAKVLDRNELLKLARQIKGDN